MVGGGKTNYNSIKNIKYLGINLMIYIKTIKPYWKQIRGRTTEMKINKKQLHKWKNNSYSWIKILYITKMLFLPKLIYRCKIVSFTIPATLLWKLINEFYNLQAMQRANNSKTIFEKEQSWKIMLPYAKISIIKL